MDDSGIGEGGVRTERFFVEYIGPTMNRVIGSPSGRFMHMQVKRETGKAIQAAGAHHIEPFTRPVELWFSPKVARGRSGRISKQYDALNFMLTLKCIEDVLVQRGVLQDDSRDWVHAAHCLRSELAEDGIPGIEVVIREVDAEPIGVQAGLELVEPRAF